MSFLSFLNKFYKAAVNINTTGILLAHVHWLYWWNWYLSE